VERSEGEAAMTVERDEEDFKPWPGETVDPVGAAISTLIGVVSELTTVGSAEHRAAMIAVLKAHERLREVLNPRRRLN
jgi:hypothetical protein